MKSNSFGLKKTATGLDWATRFVWIDGQVVMVKMLRGAWWWIDTRVAIAHWTDDRMMWVN